MLGRRRPGWKADLVSDGRAEEGRRDGCVLVDHVAVKTRSRRGHEKGHGRPACSAQCQPHAFRWEAVDLRRLRGFGPGLDESDRPQWPTIAPPSRVDWKSDCR